MWKIALNYGKSVSPNWAFTLPFRPNWRPHVPWRTDAEHAGCNLVHFAVPITANVGE